jgi:pimeloyl-ACP methyl ester carboxylesterase
MNTSIEIYQSKKYNNTMKLNNLLILLASITPALTQESKWSVDSVGNSFEEEQEDSLDLSDVLSGLNNVYNYAVGVFTKDEEAKEKAIKAIKHNIKPNIATDSEVKRHWIHAGFAYCFKYNKSLRSCNHIDCKGYSVYKTFMDPKEKTFVTVGVDPDMKEVIIAHRGTSNMRNWASNANFPLKPLEGFSSLKVHSGFFDVLRKNEDEVDSFVLSLLNGKYKGFKTVFTGHSLGAAVATIHALRLNAKVKKAGSTPELFAYHSPRAGDQAFARYVSGLSMKIARYTNKNDPVSRLLTRSLGYSHILGEYHYPSNGKSAASVIKCNSTVDEDPHCGAGETFVRSKVEDHSFAFDINKDDFCK